MFFSPIPNGIFSNRGLQFTTQFWSKCIWSKSNLTSWFHPKSNEQTRSEKQPYAAYLLQISLSRVHTFPGLNMFTTPCHTQLPVWFLFNLTLNTYPNYSQLMKEKLMPPSSSLMQTGIKWRQRSSGQQIRIRSWLTDGGPQPLFITQVRKFGGGGLFLRAFL